MISEPDIGRCANEDVSPKGVGKLRDPTSVGKGNETFLMSVEISPQWTHFKTLRKSPKRTNELKLLQFGKHNQS